MKTYAVRGKENFQNDLLPTLHWEKAMAEPREGAESPGHRA